jgi:hypothetical protein
MIFGPKPDGTYVIEFRTAAGEALAISIPRGETAVIRHFRTVRADVLTSLANVRFAPDSSQVSDIAKGPRVVPG